MTRIKRIAWMLLLVGTTGVYASKGPMKMPMTSVYVLQIPKDAARQLTPGDRVDVEVTYTVQDERVTEGVLNQVRVLQISEPFGSPTSYLELAVDRPQTQAIIAAQEYPAAVLTVRIPRENLTRIEETELVPEMARSRR